MSALTAKHRTYSSVSDEELMRMIEKERECNPNDFNTTVPGYDGYEGTSANFLRNTSATVKSTILKWL